MAVGVTCLALLRDRKWALTAALPLCYGAARLSLKPKNYDWNRETLTPQTAKRLIPSQVASLLTWIKADRSLRAEKKLNLLDSLNPNTLRQGGEPLCQQLVDTAGRDWTIVLDKKQIAAVVPNLSIQTVKTGYQSLIQAILEDSTYRSFLGPMVAATTDERRRELLDNFWSRQNTRLHELHRLEDWELICCVEFGVYLGTKDSLSTEQKQLLERWENSARQL